MLRPVCFPAALLLAACGTQVPSAAWQAGDGYRWRPLTPQGSGTPGFTRMGAERTGIGFQNSLSDSALLGNRILGQGAGLALGDVDGDGRVDLFLARTEGPNALYRNLGGWRFEDVTAAAGVAAAERASTGAAFSDLDGDGDLDLLLLATLGPNGVFLNDGAGRFREADLGLAPGARGATTPALADADGDGDLDLYIANYKPYTPLDSLAPAQRAFPSVVRRLGSGRFEVVPERRRDYRIVDREDMGGLSLSVRAEPDEFYLNEGGRFVPVALAGGDRFRDAEGRALAEADQSFGLSARFADLNGDGAPDLYVVNDFEDPDRFWINDGAGRFRLAPWTALRQTSNSGMGADIADLNGDGLPDLFEVDMLSQESRRWHTQVPTHTAVPKQPGALRVQLQQMRNTLFLNRGDGSFAEIAAYAGVSASGWSWGTLLLDVDLDGWQDILIANGHVRDVMDGDTQERLRGGWTASPWQRHLFEYPPLPLSNLAYRNRGTLRFDEVSAAWRFGGEDDLSHALAAGDLDGDGDLDVVVGRLGAAVLLLRNDAPAPRIAVRLRGRAPNTQAVGARVRVRGGAIPLQEREIAAGGLYLAHSDYLASFATGPAATVDLSVRWRNGAETMLAGVPVNREIEITEPPAGTAAIRDATPAAAPLFADATAELGGHTHREQRFDDWGRQFLLPDGLSTSGPGVSWFDVDGDGDEDLLVAAGKGDRPALFRNTGARLVPERWSGPPASQDQSTLLGWREADRARLLFGVSTWELRSVEERMAESAVLGAELAGGRPAPRTDAVVGATESSVGPLALGDYDGDGDLDLFVGGRAIPMGYPRSPSSALFRNQGGGRFTLDSEAGAALRGAGMVSAALFSDVDGDGDPDLVLARDWAPLLLLLNRSGRFEPAPESWGLGRWPGRWNGIAAGDLDGDGRLDLVVTAWGGNTTAQADPARPLLLAYGPFGTRGEVEMLVARQDPRLGAPAPLTRFERARVAIPAIASRIRSFAAYADAGIDQLLEPVAAQTSRLHAATLEHMVFLNRGGRFDAVPLPPEAQFAPAFHVSIADFDGDGAEDLFLAQNFSNTPVGEPRYDAGRGLLLRNDGTGRFTALSAAASGIAIYGDQRGAAHADADGDGRLDLVVSQNGAETRFYRNRGARPGLRVRIAGTENNPEGIGALVRLIFADRQGPVREVHAGAGYWSQPGAVQVLGVRPDATPTAVWIRWPGGGETRTPVPAGAREIVLRP